MQKKNCELTSHGYVEVSSKQHARLVTSTAKKDHLALPGFDKVRIKPENTDADKNKNWALNKAQKILKEDYCCYGKLIEKSVGRVVALRLMESMLLCNAIVMPRAANLYAFLRISNCLRGSGGRTTAFGRLHKFTAISLC